MDLVDHVFSTITLALTVVGPAPGPESPHSVRPGTGMARDGGSLAFPGFRELSQC